MKVSSGRKKKLNASSLRFCNHGLRRQSCALVAGYLGLDRDTVRARLGSDWMKEIGFFLNEIRKRIPGWPDYVDPYFDPGEFCRRKVIGLRW